MGGNALKSQGIDSVRLDAAEYFPEVEKVVGDLSTRFGVELKVVPAYRTKESFGDADILVSSTPEAWDKMTRHLKNTTTHYSNGKVFSYGHDMGGRIFQVDLIYTGSTPEQMSTNYDYFGFNDLGNLVGRLAHLHGFKYGHKGLFYVLRDPDDGQNVVAELVASTDTREIHEFLGLDHSVFQKGFENLEDIFKWVEKSKFFHPDIYLLENVNAVARIRDIKRSTYTKFLEWNKSLDASEYLKYEGDAKKLLRQVGLFTFLSKNESFGNAYFKAMESFLRMKLSKQFLNGDIVKDLTGKSGKELGILMKELKEKFPVSVILDDPKAVSDYLKSL